MITKLFLVAALTTLPYPPGWRPHLENVSPKAKEHRESLGRPMARHAAPQLIPRAPLQGIIVTNIAFNGGLITMGWTGTNQVFQIEGTPSLQLGPWNQISGPTTAYTKTFDPDFDHFFRLQGNIIMPLEITHTNPTTLVWSAPEISMSDSLQPFRVLDAPSIPANDTPTNETGWTLKTTINPGSPLTYDDTSSLPRAYKVRQTTANGVVVPYNVPSLSQTGPGSIVWAEQFDVGALTIPYATASSPDGSIWVAIGNDNTLSSIYLYKLNSNGGILIANQYPPSGGRSGCQPRALVVDSSGNVYMTGWNSNDVLDFGNGHSLTRVSVGSASDVFVVKFNSDGVCQAAANFGSDYSSSPAVQSALSICVLSSGAIVIGGRFQGTINFGNSISLAGGTSTTSGFILKLSNSLVSQWAVQVSPSALISGVAKDSSDNIYGVGRWALGGNGSFDSIGGAAVSIPITSGHFTDIFMVKYNSSGVVLTKTDTTPWVVHFGPAGAGIIPSAWGVAVGPDNNPVMVGAYTGTMNAGGGDITSSNNNYDGFVVKYLAAGTYSWSFFPTTKSQYIFGGNAGVVAVAVDANNNVIVTGAFISSVDVARTVSGGGPQTAQLTSRGGFDIFEGKYSGSGQFIWAYDESGPGSNEWPFSVAVDNNGVGLFGGIFAGDRLTPSNNVLTIHNSAPRFNNGTPYSPSVGDQLTTTELFANGYLLKVGP